jgi:regulator of replication initiation timing
VDSLRLSHKMENPEKKTMKSREGEMKCERSSNTVAIYVDAFHIFNSFRFWLGVVWTVEPCRYGMSLPRRESRRAFSWTLE